MGHSKGDMATAMPLGECSMLKSYASRNYK